MVRLHDQQHPTDFIASIRSNSFNPTAKIKLSPFPRHAVAASDVITCVK